MKLKNEESDVNFDVNAGSLLRETGYYVLSREETLEILNSTHPENHVIAAKFFEDKNIVLLVRGDFKIIRIMTYQFPVMSDVQPDFNDVGLEDLGLTLRFGKYTIDAQPMIVD